ncbi:Imm30 family immunity protein [Pyxidicoccus sp. 3LG]
MTMQQLLDTLTRNRLLETRGQVEAFDKALEQFAVHPEASAHLRELHLVLDDRTTKIGVMWGVIHLLESFDIEKQLQGFIAALPTLQKQAPEFVKTLNFRLLNDEAARGRYKAAYQAADTPARSLLASSLAEIIETEEPPLRDYACEVVAPS